MKKLILLVVFTLPLMAQAQPPEGQDWWACQSVESAGVRFKDGKWEITRFNHDERFVLIGDETNLVTLDSVGKVFGTSPEDINCEAWQNQVSCASIFGESFMFNIETARGCQVRLLGSTDADDKRDSVYVEPFECIKG